MMEHNLIFSFKILNIVGVHPRKNIAKSVVIFNHLLLILIITLSIVKYILDPQILHFESFSILFHILGKYLVLIFQRNALTPVLDYLKYFWNINFQDDRNKVLTRYINMQKYYVIYLGIAVSQLTITGIILPGQTVFDCYIPKGVPPALFYILEAYTIFFGMVVYCGWNILFCILTLLVVPQLRALNAKIKDLNLDQIKDGYDVRVCLNTIRSHVSYHNFLLRYIKDLNGVLSLPITLLLGSNILTSCVCMYNIPASETLLYRFRSILIFVALIIEFFFLYGLPAQLLMDEATVIGDSIYNYCSWYLPNIIPVRKCLLMIIIRSQYITRISAEGFIDINYKTTVFMLKTAYTFYAFLQTIK